MQVKFIVIILACMFCSSCSLPLKDKAVPEEVKNTFHQKFPQATKVKWTRRGLNAFQAKIWAGDKISKAVFNKDGKFMEAETSIDASALPQPVIEYINTNYKNARISEATKITRSDGSIFYETELNNKDIYLTPDGKPASPEIYQ
ncbi:MAG: hypothetical protein JWN76_1403 [Chitinophagaceae bacterium]|nr:hypothetical protein [Chitinophagaceae bacterium]